MLACRISPIAKLAAARDTRCNTPSWGQISVSVLNMEDVSHFVHWLKLECMYLIFFIVLLMLGTYVAQGRVVFNAYTFTIAVAFATTYATVRFRRDRGLRVLASVFPLLLCFSVVALASWAYFHVSGSPSDIGSQVGVAALEGGITALLGALPLRWLQSTFGPSRFAH